MHRFFPLFLVTAFIGARAIAGASDLEKIESFLEANCFECHDDTVSKGGLNLFELDPESISGLSDVDRWTHIFDRVKNGEMPPEKKREDLKRETVNSFLLALTPQLKQADKELREVVQRRLNRTEYEHTMQDLLGIDIDLQPLLPPDQKAGGFDNNGAALAISSELVESYLQAARLALDAALVDGPAPKQEPSSMISLKNRNHILESNTNTSTASSSLT